MFKSASPTSSSSSSSSPLSSSVTFVSTPSFLRKRKSQTQSIHVTYKRGHDLRQDQVILQLLRIMDGFLKAESLDCCMTPYKCVPMVENQGLIQIVRHTTTVANIVQSIVADASRTKRGSLRHKLTSAMKAMCEKKVIVKWLKKQGQLRTHDIRMISQAFLLFPYRGVNSGSDAKKKPHRDLVVDTFARSCSGYCVATYVLGIGDR